MKYTAPETYFKFQPCFSVLIVNALTYIYLSFKLQTLVILEIIDRIFEGIEAGGGGESHMKKYPLGIIFLISINSLFGKLDRNIG